MTPRCGMLLLLFASQAFAFSSVVQVTCPKSCSTCMCSSCKNETFQLGKCIAADGGDAVIGKCTKGGKVFVEDIYLNKKCSGQKATESQINTDACVHTQGGEYCAWFCEGGKEGASNENAFDNTAVAGDIAPRSDPVVLRNSDVAADDFVLTASAIQHTNANASGNPTDYGNPSVGCRQGEVNVTIEGMHNASFCSPKCTSQTAPVGHRCPTKVPPGTTAQPLCTVREPGSTGAPDRCSLVCAGLATGKCPHGSTCQIIGLGVGACFFPQQQ